jgi:hypothetical protein
VETPVDRLFRVANKGRGNRPTSIGRTQHQWDGDLPPFPSSPAAHRGRP